MKQEIWLNAIFGSCLVMAPIAFGLVDYKEAVVKIKAGKTVMFNTLNSKKTDLNTIRFNDAARDMEYYDNIKVGDTISVRTFGLGGSYKTDGFLNNASIKKINGKTLEELKSLKYKNANQKQR